MGLPDDDTGGPGGGGTGLPDRDSGGPGSEGAGRPGAGPPPERPPGSGAAGRPAGGAVGRGRGVTAADAAGRGGAAGVPSMSERRTGRSLPDDVTSRPGGAGGVGRVTEGRGGAGGGMRLAGVSGAGGAAGVASAAGRSAGTSTRGCAGRSVSVGSAAAGGAGSGRAVGAGVSTAGTGVDATAVFCAAATFLAAAFLVGAFLLAAALSALADSTASSVADMRLGASGWRSRTRPSRWARRRTRSACASSMPEECVLTPMPNARQRSRHSLLVSPSSLASSWTRIFAAKFSETSPSVFSWARPTHRSVRIAVPYPRADPATGTNTGTLGPMRLSARRAPSTRRERPCRARLRVPAVYGPRRWIPRVSVRT
jgi:hypothetical protein